MPKNKVISPCLAASVLVIGLMGCDGGGGGGGGDDEGDVAPPPADANLLASSTANAIPVAGQVLNRFAWSLELGRVALAFNPVHPRLLPLFFAVNTNSVTASAAAGESDARAWSVPFGLFDDPAQPLRRIPAQTETLTIALVVDQTVPCAGGGSVILSGSIESTSRISVGDRLTSQYLDCIISGLEQPINGSISSTITAVGGDGTLQTLPYRFAIASVFTGFTVPLPAPTTILPVMTIDGDSTWQFGTDDAVVFEDVTSGGRILLSVTGSSDPNENGSSVLVEFTSALTRNAANPDLIAYSADGGAGFEPASFGGAVGVGIEPDLAGLIGIGASEFPSRGRVLITGALGSTVTIAAVSETQVQIDLDENGDDVSDATWVLEWRELLPEGFFKGIGFSVVLAP